MNFKIAGLALEPTQRLMDHYARMRQSIAFTSAATSQQNCTHTSRLTGTQGTDVGFDKLHGIVDRKARGNRTTRAVDI